MANQVDVRLNHAELGAILKSAAVQRDLAARAARVAASAGNGFEARSTVGPKRARAAVITTTVKAMRREARDAILARALGAARG